jgi:bifunctional non-homologous end joining protein LigD
VRSGASTLLDFIPFATCLLIDRPTNGPDWIREIKLDGWRIPDPRGGWSSHPSHPERPDYSQTFPEHARIARGFDTCIIDGEVCSVRKTASPTSQLQAPMKAAQMAGLIFAFDLLFSGPGSMCATPRRAEEATPGAAC